MERFRQDLSYAVRLLFKNKGFTITAVVTLAVCIAANAAIFCIVNSVVLRPLPFPEPDRLVFVSNSYPKAGAEWAANAVPDYFDRLSDVKALREIGLYNSQGRTIGSAGDTERVTGATLTPSMFSLLRVRTYRGRIFSESEGEIGNEKKVVLTYGLWQRRFGGRDSAVGSDLRVNGVPFTVVGVLPREFDFPGASEEPELYVPAAFTAQEKSDDARHSNSWQMVGRLAPGASIEQVQKQVNALNARNLERFPGFKQILINTGFKTIVSGFQDEIVSEVKSILYLLWAGAGFVLLIGGVNVANLVLVRATSRLKELATRHVLGASPARLARQLLTETTLLTLVGGGLGLLLSYWTLSAIRTVGIERLPRASEIGLDTTVVLFTVTVSLLMGAALGILPVLTIRKSSLNQAFREEGRSTTGGKAARLLRAGLVTAQVAIALALLVGAGLLFASFRRVLAVDPGFKTENVLTARLNLPPAKYKDDPALRAFADRALEQVRALPGVVTAGFSNSIPFGDAFNSNVIFAEDYVMAPGESLIAPLQVTASDGYFEALRVPLVTGRFFDRRDVDGAQRTVIVDERMAKKFWPNKSPIGRRMFRPNNPQEILKPAANTVFFTVVGVVREVKYVGMTPVARFAPVGTCYFPAAQDPIRNAFVAIRTQSSPAAVIPALRKTVAAIDAELPLYDVKMMQERLDASLANRRTPMLLALVFAAVALFLAAVGVYGVLAYQVTQRTREIGIRMALGGGVPSIFRLVLRDGMTMIAIGLLAGLAGGFAVGRGLRSQLFGVGSMDPGVVALVVVVLTIIGTIACVVPAIRATRVDPVRALADQ